MANTTNAPGLQIVPSDLGVILHHPATLRRRLLVHEHEVDRNVEGKNDVHEAVCPEQLIDAQLEQRDLVRGEGGGKGEADERHHVPCQHVC